ncbi:MAG: hypothetical protein WC209_07350 [Ignavibacteriaceae bacterium]|jgi:hypothetical protein
MLAIVKREDLTHEILIDNNEISELRTLKLPENWWHTTISHDLEKSKHTLKLIKFNPQTIKRGFAPSLPKTDYWDVKSGDYRVKDVRTKPVNFNPEYKRVLGFALFSFTMILTIATVVFILSLIAKV